MALLKHMTRQQQQRPSDESQGQLQLEVGNHVDILAGCRSDNKISTMTTDRVDRTQIALPTRAGTKFTVGPSKPENDFDLAKTCSDIKKVLAEMQGLRTKADAYEKFTNENAVGFSVLLVLLEGRHTNREQLS